MPNLRCSCRFTEFSLVKKNSTSLRQWFFLAICALFCVALSTSVSAAGEKIHFEIPALRADEALQLFAGQSHTPVLFTYDEVADVKTNSVVGDYFVKEALDELLRDSGISGKINQNGVLTIVRASGIASAETGTSTSNTNKGVEGMSSTRTKLGVGGVVTAFFAGLLGSQAGLAQSPGASSSGALEEIVVTAQKREENLMEIPIAVTAFSGDQLARIGMSDVRDMKTLVPSLHTGDNFNGNVTTTLRGVQNSTAYYVDGIFMPSQTSAMALNYDVERFEVLRGPQGTLYGKDSSAGTIHIINKKPTDELDANIQLTAGDFAHLAARGMVNLPVSDTLKLRGSFVVERRDALESTHDSIDTLGNPLNLSEDPGEGYFSIDKTGVRLAALWEPTDTFTVNVSGEWYNNQSPPTRQEIQLPVSPVDPFGRWNRNVVNAPEYDQEMISLRGRADWAITDNMMLTYLAGWQSEEILNIGSSTREAPNTILYLQDPDRTNYNHEIRLQSTSDSRFQWTVGGFYHKFEEDTSTEIFIWDEPLPSAQNPLRSNTRTATGIRFGNRSFTLGREEESLALFNHNTYDLTEDIRLTAGIRYTNDTKGTADFHRNSYPGGPAVAGLHPAQARALGFVAFGPSLSAEHDWENFSWKLGVDWNITDEHMVYFAASTGYKSGGFTLSNNTNFDEENLLSLEGGLKSTLLDGRMQLALTGYIYDYEDFQGSAVVPDGSGVIGQNTTITTNAASASLAGIELEYNWQATDALRFMGHVSWQDATFDSYPNAPFDPAFLPLSGTVDLTGGRMPNTPEYEMALTAIYDYQFSNGATLVPSITWAYTDDQYLRIYARDDIDLEPGYHKLDGNIRYTSADTKWYVEAFVQNATDEFARQAAFQSGQLSYNAIYVERRLWGARIGYDFF